MASHEALLVIRDVLFDAHVRIAETHQGNLAVLLSEHRGLLAFARSALGLVVAGELVTLVVDHWLFGKTYQPAGRVTVDGPTNFLFESNP